MPIIERPNTRAFAGAQFQLGLDVSESVHTGFLTNNRTRRSNLADRLRGTWVLPPTPDRVAAAAREAVLMEMRSNGSWLRMPVEHRPVPQGTLRGSPTVQTSVLAGARSLTLANGRAGTNLLRRADQITAVLLASWTGSNASLTAGETDPQGGTGAYAVTSTAAGNHFISQTIATTSHTQRNFTFRVWLKAGTASASTSLILRDGSGTTYQQATVTLTSTWALYTLSAYVPAGAAANLMLYVDPATNAAAAGETFFVWLGELERATAVLTNAVVAVNETTGPQGDTSGCALIRLAAGNHFAVWTYATTAHAGQTFTFSVYLNAGTLTGNVTLRLRDGAGAEIATSTVTPTASWARYSVTGTFGATPAANVNVFIDPTNDAGAPGDSLLFWGEMLNPGGAADTFTLLPTLLAGDFISAGGNLLQVAYPGATGDVTGAITVPLTMPAPRALTAGAVVECNAPTGLWELDDDGLQLDYTAGNVQQGVAIPLRQVVV